MILSILSVNNTIAAQRRVKAEVLAESASFCVGILILIEVEFKQVGNFQYNVVFFVGDFDDFFYNKSGTTFLFSLECI